MEEVIKAVKAVFPRVAMRGLIGGRTLLIGASVGVLSVVILLLAVILTIAFQDPADTSIYSLQNFRDLYLE